MFQFANPKMLWLLTVLLPLAAYYVYRLRNGAATITVSDTSSVVGVRKTWRYYGRHLPFLLECVAVALCVVALARPQSSEHGSTVRTEGIDIVLAVDVSGSMLARDFDPDRITAAKDVAAKFIVDRQNDRIGLVIFAGESFTQSPLTTDKSTLLTLLGQIRSGVLDDGTAIGNGLATAVNRLKESSAKSKVVILLTDGVNNMGQVAPLTAAEIAASYGIKVYTVGVGTRGMAPYPAYDMWGNMVFQQVKVEIDEQVLTDIAEMTGGEYFRAVDNRSLAEIYEQIDQLEKTKIDTDEFVKYNELFGRYLVWAFVLLVVGFGLEKLWLKRIP
ncbi:MAG: VWA domain-containing protein [Tidjanibacter sp.]|nr:VWA domain-containing protein [Tidjanibacter sp.]